MIKEIEWKNSKKCPEGKIRRKKKRRTTEKENRKKRDISQDLL
jgi:hypothetical protein